MQYTSLSLASLVAVAASMVSAESNPFGIISIRSGSDIQYGEWGYDSAGHIVIASVSSSATSFTSLVVEDNNSVKTSDGRYFVVGDDSILTLSDDASAATTTFGLGTVEEGPLVDFIYNGATGFVTCPDDAGNYILYTKNPIKSDDSKCEGLSAQASLESSSSSSSSSSAVSTSSEPSGYANSTSTYITTNQATTQVTVTSCSDNACSTSATGAVTTSTPAVTELTGAAGIVAGSSIAAFGALAVALLA